MNWQRALGVTIFILLLLPVVLIAPSPAADVSSAEPLGMRSFATSVADDDRQVVTLFASQSALRYTDEEARLLVVPGFPRALTSGETAALTAHLEEGAWIWVLDETGNGDRLTEPAGIRVVPEGVLDPESPFGDERFVEATVGLGDDPLNTTFEILLTAPTVLEVNSTLATLLGETREAFRDVDRSGAIEATDPAGNHPILAAADVGPGRLVVASDTGLFINTVMRAQGYQNAQLLGAMLDQAPEGTVVVDASRHDPTRPMAPLKAATQGLLWATTDTLALVLLGAAAALLGFHLVRQAPERVAWGRHEHRLGDPRPVPGSEQHERLRRLLVLALRERVRTDASDLIAEEDDVLEELAQTHLGPGQYLSGRGGIDERFQTLLATLESGGTQP